MLSDLSQQCRKNDHSKESLPATEEWLIKSDWCDTTKNANDLDPCSVVDDLFKQLQFIPDKTIFVRSLKSLFSKMDSELLRNVYSELSLYPESELKDRMAQNEKILQDSHHENALLQQALYDSKK